MIVVMMGTVVVSSNGSSNDSSNDGYSSSK